MKIVYIVEDDDKIREILKKILFNHGFLVQGFERSASFRMRIQDKLPDLIIMDIMLPDENGNEICKEFKANHITQHIPIVMMSAMPFLSAESFADDYISKPFRMDDFISRVDQQIA